MSWSWLSCGPRCAWSGSGSESGSSCVFATALAFHLCVVCRWFRGFPPFRALFNVNGHAIGFDRYGRRHWCFGQAGKPAGSARMFIEDPVRHTLCVLSRPSHLCGRAHTPTHIPLPRCTQVFSCAWPILSAVYFPPFAPPHPSYAIPTRYLFADVFRHLALAHHLMEPLSLRMEPRPWFCIGFVWTQRGPCVDSCRAY